LAYNNRQYGMNLECPDFSIYGSFLAGFPFPVLGHNRFHAWGLTILENDDLDFFAEQVNPEDSNYVFINGKNEKIQIRQEVIKVKDSADVIIQCRSTSHGPICSDVVEDFSSVTPSPVSICWTLLKFPDNLPEVTWKMSHAKSMAQFREAVSLIAAPGLNVIYADADNNIAWYTAAKYVIRPKGVNPNLILDGSGKHDWLGYYDFSVNPKSENPGRGVVLSANNPPSKDSMDLFPGYYVPEDRYVRINYYFYSKKFLNHTDMQNMNTDVVNDIAVQCAQAMLAKLSGAVKLRSHIHTRASEIIDRWNGSHELNDIAPVIYYKWLYHVFHDAFSDELGEKDFEAFLKTHIQKTIVKPFLLNDSSVWWDTDSTQGKIETSKEIVENAFDKTVSELIEQFGYNPEKWLWRKVHYLEIEHPVGKQKPLDKLFNIGPYPIVGGIETINNQSFDLNANGKYKVNLAPALRRTIDFADPENAYSISPSGQSGSFMSGFYRDQTKRYINRKVRKEMMNKNEIEKSYYSRMFFVPPR
jgi:penicillin G amidase